MRTFYRLALLSALFTAGCATGPTIRIDQDPAANMAQYKTFGFYDHVATDQTRYSTIMSTRLKQMTREQLERLGFTYDENAPQLRVNFFVKIADKQEIRSSAPGPAGFYRYRVGSYRAWSAYPYDIETVDYKAGTLSVDLVDVKANALVWQGLAEGKVKKEAFEHPDKAIDAVVAEIFRGFPNSPSTKQASL
jgi:hypothetical protein